MAEYIERCELQSAMKFVVTDDIACPLHIAAEIDQVLDLAPAADVRPERHGEWFGTVCTNCGESTSFWYDCDFCPQCGAKMDGKGGDNNDNL